MRKIVDVKMKIDSSSTAARSLNSIQVTWDDNKVSNFLHAWLIDHAPENIHQSSNQRNFDSSLVYNFEIKSNASNSSAKAPQGSISKTEVLAKENKLKVHWAHKPYSSFPDVSIFDGNWLRNHSYDDWAREERIHRYSKDKTLSHTLWQGPELMARNLLKPIDAKDVLKNPQGPLEVLESLASVGVALIVNMPLTSEGTEEIVRTFAGRPRETFYGRMWDTAPKKAEDVNDTAYTKEALDPHTDTTYLFDSPGLQCFNCVAQSTDEKNPRDGATKLVDGFHIVQQLRLKHPDAFRFFSTTPLVFQHIEKGVYVKNRARVIDRIALNKFEESGVSLVDDIRQIRYNSYDLAPIDYLTSSQVAQFYESHAILTKLIRDEENIALIKMKPGQMVVVNNHRVMHGRTAYTGYRNLVGCYVGKDDWEGHLRSLRGSVPSDKSFV